MESEWSDTPISAYSMLVIQLQSFNYVFVSLKFKTALLLSSLLTLSNTLGWSLYFTEKSGHQSHMSNGDGGERIKSKIAYYVAFYVKMITSGW